MKKGNMIFVLLSMGMATMDSVVTNPSIRGHGVARAECSCEENRVCKIGPNYEGGLWCVVAKLSNCPDRKPHGGYFYSKIPCEEGKEILNDPKNSISYRVLTPHKVEEATKLVAKSFMSEPITSKLKKESKGEMTFSEDDIVQFVEPWSHHISEGGFSVYARNENNEIVGALLAHEYGFVPKEDVLGKNPQYTTKPLSKVGAFLAGVEEKGDKLVEEKIKGKKGVDIFLLAVPEEQRGKKIAVKLVQAFLKNLETLKQYEFATVVNATNGGTAAVAKKNEFEQVYEENFSNFDWTWNGKTYKVPEEWGEGKSKQGKCTFWYKDLSKA